MSDPVLQLDEQGINAINQAVGRHNQELARLHRGALPEGSIPPAALYMVGGAVSQLLPVIAQALALIHATGDGGIPTAEELGKALRKVLTEGEPGATAPITGE